MSKDDRPAGSATGSLRGRMAEAVRKVEAVEAAYEPGTVARLITSQARKLGSKTAIDVFERGERASYEEMDRWSNRYANALKALGVRKGERIGVMLPNRIEFPLLWFAFAKLGAVLVPLNMRYTPREIEFVLSDTQATFAIVDDSAWTAFSAMEPWPKDLVRERVFVAGRAPGPAVKTLASVLQGAGDAPLQEDVGPQDLLNIQYTSGTTGFPKGCLLTQEYWDVTTYQHATVRDLRPYDRQLSWAPFFYSYGPTVLLKCWREGGTLFLAQQLSASRMADWLKTYRIEWCSMTEFVARQVKAGDGPALQQVGQYDGWAADTVRHLREQLGVRSRESYGMTEVGYATLPTDIEEMDESGYVGIRAPLRELRIVNDDGTPTAVGEMGEMWVRGRGVLKGYWNRPEANAELFEDGWFKTGDLVRRDELGCYWLVGRKKDMIRRSSENIAALEVEAVIRRVPGVDDVAAVPVKDAKRGEEVKVCVELKPGVEPGDELVQRILEHARGHLAPFKVPRYVAFIAKLPRTSSNKVTKRHLTDVPDPLADTYDAVEKRWH